VLSVHPTTVLAILRSAQSSEPDPRLDEVLAAFRRHWLSIARRRYPSLEEVVEDAVQTALLKLVSGERLAHLKEVDRLEAWARSIFINTLLDLARETRRHWRGRVEGAGPDDDPDTLLRETVPATQPSPEEQATQRERLAVVARCIEGVEVAKLKFVEGLADREIAERQGLTRDGVAGQLKRLRKVIRAALEDAGVGRGK
jgi:RNA polymerase sigma-70 factor, ECF subfamily